MGVKQLWTLLSPVGRPVLLETMEGKALAIDSSIWIYQFQATMRDKEGRGLNNAHILGFLRRICKLIFYGIKPVFVFDGGAPALKRSTIIERKRRKAGAALSHAKVAERLLAAQMRREALSHLKTRQSAGKASTADIGPIPPKTGILNDDTVYMEDLLPPVISPQKLTPQPPAPNPPESPKKYEWKDHDPYKLPDVDMSARVAAATRPEADGDLSGVDPRLATEEELRHFIDNMRPEDFDANSPAFRELPTEVQYEIIGDLRLKSRQTSHSRLQNMLKSSRTALDFSKAQIRGLHARNALTQQLLMTTNSMGNEVDYHLTIPVRIAAERNREYVLVKNSGPAGGWSLGIKDEGTKEKPIQVQPDSDDDDDMEEVPINEPPLEYSNVFDNRRMGLASIGKASTGSPKSRHASLPPKPETTEKAEPLFMGYGDVDSDHLDDDDLDLATAAAIEESWKEQEAQDLKTAIEASRQTPSMTALQSQGAGPSRPRVILEQEEEEEEPESPIEFVQLPVTPPAERNLPKARSITPSNSGVLPSVGQTLSTNGNTGKQDILEARSQKAQVEQGSRPVLIDTSKFFSDSPPPSPKIPTAKPQPVSKSVVSHRLDEPLASPHAPTKLESPVKMLLYDSPHKHDQAPVEAEDVDEDMEEVDLELDEDQPTPLPATVPPMPSLPTQQQQPPEPISPNMELDEEEEEQFFDWSRSPSPKNQSGQTLVPSMQQDANVNEEERDWDAAHEVDVEGEEGEFARFVSQVKGKDLDTVRGEIEMEIKELHKAKKNHQRDSEEITQQMVSQIMVLLRLFGIPYITAPMEAEAQCATLLSLGLVEGVITDDSDVFLFGATRVFKNMFNQSKTVECFLASDLQRELGLTREKLIQLAYLLGSDYVDGLEKVGPVVAMEILNEFDDKSGGKQDTLLRFKEWWSKVQTGKDKDEHNPSDFKKRFKKKFKDLHLSSDWPNPTVRDAYFHPTVDQSEEAFKWGLPDLDALRSFLGEELRWSQSKVDDLLVPIIRKMGERSRNITANRQSTLSGYFDASGGFGSGTMAPRKRQPYASKRLQQVVSDYRKKKDLSRAATPLDGPTPGADIAETTDQVTDQVKTGRGAGKKRSKAATPAKPRKRQKVVDPESESEAEPETSIKKDEVLDANLPDRPLNVTLRKRTAAKVIEDESSDDLE
ncbi:hypothetical protein M408DRAFT_326175 [Serendipita vermifera MAFF 305830]|uniref:PIN domain-like protein n=1 Tax=Serendipita vermifera MAFF 305830 TaxID=933852 RepID=A0A0C3BPS4_SERVB|nr:hypothetical protein M408DRAFT_326175 [Serendipita vermifera MAFF 305830]